MATNHRISAKHQLRLLEHMECLNRRLQFKLSFEDLAKAYSVDTDLGRSAVETIVGNVAGLSRLLKLAPEELQPLLLAHPTLFRRSPASVHGNICDTAAILGMRLRAYTLKMLKVRRLVNVAPDRVRRVIGHLVDELGLPERTVIALLRRQLPLLCSDPETLSSNAKRSAEILGLPLSEFVRMVCRSPGLLSHPPDTLRTRVLTLASRLAVDETDALRAVQRHPPLLALAPDTIVRNLRGAADLLDIDVAVWSRIVVRKPMLLGYRPERFREGVMAMSMIFACSTGVVVEVFLRHPALTACKPSSVAAKLPLVMELCEALGFSYAPVDALKACPLAFTYADLRLRQRLALARRGVGPRSIMNLLSLPQEDADLLLRDHCDQEAA